MSKEKKMSNIDYEPPKVVDYSIEEQVDDSDVKKAFDSVVDFVGGVVEVITERRENQERNEEYAGFVSRVETSDGNDDDDDDEDADED